MGHDGPVSGDPHSPGGADGVRVVLGVGTSRGCPPDELADLADACLAAAGTPRAAVAAVASADVKADEPAVLALADALGVPTRFLPASALAAIDVPTPSATVARHVGTPSVAEAAALLVAAWPDGTAGPAAAGSGATDPAAATGRPAPPGTARLLVPKRRSAHATCAVACAVVPRDRPATPEGPVGRGLPGPRHPAAPSAPTEVPAP